MDEKQNPEKMKTEETSDDTAEVWDLTEDENHRKEAFENNLGLDELETEEGGRS